MQNKQEYGSSTLKFDHSRPYAAMFTPGHGRSGYVVPLHLLACGLQIFPLRGAP